MRILIIDQHTPMRDALRNLLEEETFIVDTAINGDTGSYTARTNQYDVIILNTDLPDKNAFQVCREIRAENKKVPIIAVSSKVQSSPSDQSIQQEKIALLELGADDYLVKPFVFSELLARMKALLRRPYTIQEPVITLDDLTLDPGKHVVVKGKKRIYLTRKEFMLLECLMKNSGQVVTRSYIMEHVWNNDSNPFSNTVEAHIRNIRKKVDGGKKKYIHTISGRGYKIDRQK